MIRPKTVCKKKRTQGKLCVRFFFEKMIKPKQRISIFFALSDILSFLKKTNFMKTFIKFLTLSIFLFLQNQNLQAQVFVGGDAAYFLSTIVNQNNYGFSELDYEFTGNPTFGLSIGYAGNNKHHVQTGVKLLKLGQKYSSEIDNITHSKNVELHYIMIPLSYKMIFGDTETNSYATRAFFSIGGYFSFLNRAETIWSIDGEDVSFIDFYSNQNSSGDILQLAQLAGGSDLEDDKDQFESVDFGVTASIGFRTFITEGLAINFEFLGGYGLGDMNAEDWRLKNSSGIYDASNNAFGGVQLGLHYYFGL